MAYERPANVKEIMASRRSKAVDKLHELGSNPAYLIQLWQAAKRKYANEDVWLLQHPDNRAFNRAFHTSVLTEKWTKEEKGQPGGEAWGAYQFHMHLITYAKEDISEMIPAGHVPSDMHPVETRMQQRIRDRYSHYHMRNLFAPEAISPYVLGLFQNNGRSNTPPAQAPPPVAKLIPSPFFQEMHKQKASQEPAQSLAPAFFSPGDPPGGPSISAANQQPQQGQSCSLM